MSEALVPQVGAGHSSMRMCTLYQIRVQYDTYDTYIHFIYLPQATWPINTQDMQIDRKTDIIK